MDGVKRVLMIAAHPDDEDTSLLTALARGWGAETAYLSLTRGDGGQNVLGPELFEGLGVVRTGELEAARRLDGARQYFTRAFDYGFSKSADEALSFWRRDEVLADVVWVIRRFRPHVVVSVWSGTPRDGHGQHQASGILAQEAFDAAGDPSRFPEQLALGVEPWTPLKLYESARGDFGGRGGGGAVSGPGGGAGEILRIDTGTRDPLLGRSLFQLSMASRSQHRSQEQGSPQPAGPRETGVRLLRSRVAEPEPGLFAGIDTTLAGLAARIASGQAGTAGREVAARETARALEEYRTAVSRARDAFGLDLSAMLPHLGRAIAGLAEARRVAGDFAPTEVRLVLERRVEVATAAFAAAAGISLDVRADDDIIVPGQTVRISTQLWNSSALALALPAATLHAPEGWIVRQASVEGLDAEGRVPPRSLVTWAYEVRLSPTAEPTRLYYLSAPRAGAMYRWPDDPSLWGLPRDPAPVFAEVSFEPVTAAPGVSALAPRVALTSAWRHVTVDPARGEIERAVLVVPALSVRVSPEGLVWPEGRVEPRTMSVLLRNEAVAGSRGRLVVRAPAGWSVSPPEQGFELDEAGAERTLAFTVRPSGRPERGRHAFEVVAFGDDGRQHAEGYTLIDYDHIERTAFFSPAEARVSVLPVAVADGLRVGYVMGSGDDGPEALRQIGVDVTLLDEERVRGGAFEGFDAIVLGVRAQETRADLRVASERLLDYVRGGGVVVAQYNRGPLGNVAPGLDVGRNAPRVADETAPVRVLEPDAPVFTFPNRIGPADFEGWVQERGLYFASEWGPAYVPLLELHDPGEDPQRGSLLVAAEGEGVFVYTGLSFFRQWSAGVPGAYRLFANLVSLDPGAWRAYAARR
jgi:LmbE family N-acetylglucosaminyl deacetylase